MRINLEVKEVFLVFKKDRIEVCNHVIDNLEKNFDVKNSVLEINEDEILELRIMVKIKDKILRVLALIDFVG